jgi:hypothetical protein
MSSSANNFARPSAIDVDLSDDTLHVRLEDGRAISAPLAWYPRLVQGTPHERLNWQLIGAGQGIHWPDLDEDISVQALLEGRPSNETRTSFDKWLAARQSIAKQ